MVRKALRVLIVLLAAGGMLILGGGVYLRSQMRGSLAQLDGSAQVPGLAAGVRVDRDALGVPTIHGSTRADVARALGFLHAQERFFQMDLQRRQPAGELSALVGARALAADEAIRVHRFRDVAHRAYVATTANYREVLDAYAQGVNAGLAALAAPPFEYLVLRAAPEPWLPEDSILTVLAMFNTLQGRQAQFEQTMGAMKDALPEPLFMFLSAMGSAWDTPVIGNATPRPAIPDASVVDLRTAHAEARNHRSTENPFSKCTEEAVFGVSVLPCFRDDEAAIIGSNNWAVAGKHTGTGAALVANDMHLAIAVPIIWYRASFAFPEDNPQQLPRRITGVTLPGLPSMVVGSNGHVAWGFTNTGGDWSDLVRLDPDPRDPAKYLTPDGPKAFATYDETIAVKGGVARTVPVRWTIWGPVVWQDARGREYAQRWIAHEAAPLAADNTTPERARTIEDLMAAMAGLGIPNQNVTMADRSGRIAWIIGGTIPRRIGHDGLTPQSWADGTRRWDGFLRSDDTLYPRIVDPPHGRLWTANAPVVDGAVLAAIGEGGYADGIRARLIRDRLMQIEYATPTEMLQLQLDDRALFLERWRELILATLDGPAAAGTDLTVRLRGVFRDLVRSNWNGRVQPDSVGYRLVRTFRTRVVRDLMMALTEPARVIDPTFDYSRSLRGEGPVWQLLTARPPHLLPRPHDSWDAFILAAVDAAIDELTAGGRSLSDRTWGEITRTEFRHPLASAIPLFGGFLNMPSRELYGDVYTPRASTPRTGPSQRMVVSPGREEEGIMQIPTGQSGHPLSPHYGDQYPAWLNGDPAPFLPGATVHTLTLTPRQ